MLHLVYSLIYHFDINHLSLLRILTQKIGLLVYIVTTKQ